MAGVLAGMLNYWHMNNTNHKLSHLKPGKLYQYIGSNNTFYCYSMQTKTLVKIKNLEVVMVVENIYTPTTLKHETYGTILLKFLYNNEIVVLSFAETSLTESYLHDELVLLT